MLAKFLLDRWLMCGRRVRSGLEDNLQRYLHIERLTGPYAWVAEVRPECGTNGAALTGECKSDRSQVCPVEDVEQVEPELRIHSLDNLGVFDHGQVDSRVAGVIILSPARGRVL